MHVFNKLAKTSAIIQGLSKPSRSIYKYVELEKCQSKPLVISFLFVTAETELSKVQTEWSWRF